MREFFCGKIGYTSLMLMDEADIILVGGHGGAGRVAFKNGKKGGPDGGNGGRGGDVYIVATTDLRALIQFSQKQFLSGQDGQPGEIRNKSGKAGEDLTIELPLGTEILDKNSEEKFVIESLDQRLLICKGGLGGKGNFDLKSARNTTPTYAQRGLNGQKRELKINLKIIADFGLIGLPNAGKSSLLNELTKAQAKVGDYPFTTLEPNLGMIRKKILADIPGLIEGASEGKGLGIKFLKHIEKVTLLLHCISADSDDLIESYNVVINELKSFNPEMIKKKQIILLTKSDTVDKKKLTDQTKLLKKFKHKIIPVSIHDWESLQNLSEQLS